MFTARMHLLLTQASLTLSEALMEQCVQKIYGCTVSERTRGQTRLDVRCCNVWFSHVKTREKVDRHWSFAFFKPKLMFRWLCRRHTVLIKWFSQINNHGLCCIKDRFLDLSLLSPAMHVKQFYSVDRVLRLSDRHNAQPWLRTTPRESGGNSGRTGFH